jgi:hypothetical protein
MTMYRRPKFQVLLTHLLNGSAGTPFEVYYRRERSREVDFVVRSGKRLAAIEGKCGAAKGSFSGRDAFARAFRPQRTLLVGGNSMPLEQFFQTSPADLIVG